MIDPWLAPGNGGPGEFFVLINDFVYTPGATNRVLLACHVVLN